MVAPWHRPNPTDVFVEERDLSLICLRQSIAWLDGCFDLPQLRLVNHDILCDHLDQIVGRYEATIGLLNLSTKDIGYVVVSLIAISQLFSVTTHCADSVMAALEKPSLFSFKRILSRHHVRWGCIPSRIKRGLDECCWACLG